MNDIHQTGFVKPEQFTKASLLWKVYLSQEDYTKIFTHYKVKTGLHSGKLSYNKISEDLGANNHSIKLIQRGNKYLTQLKQLRAFSQNSKEIFP